MRRQSLQSVTESYRGHNVRVFRLDREGTLARLRERARRVLEQRPEVVEIRLFGSLARGTAGPGSDADLFVVVRDGAPPFLDRIPALARYFSGLGIGCDVLVYTESEYQAFAVRQDAFARAILKHGMPLARRAATAEDRQTPPVV